MADDRRIMVLMGGISAERAVSLVTGQAVAEVLESLSYQVFVHDYRGDFAALISAMQQADVVFNALHGTLGEDGRIQALGDLMHTPYTHSGVLASAVAMNKPLSCALFARHGLPIAPHICLDAAAINRLNDWPLPPPLVVKPIADGSSVGVHVILQQTWEAMQPTLLATMQDKAEILDTILDAAQNQRTSAQQLMFEEYIPGRELTVSVLDIDGIAQPLAVTELDVPDQFYDYAAKYNALDGAKHYCPAPLEQAVNDQVTEMAVKAHQILGLRGVSRSDFRYDPASGRVVILETNSQPGMTPTSLLPEQAQVFGLSFPALIVHLLQAACYD